MNPPQTEHPVFRSCLYVPGHQARLIERAYESEADTVILDLEDAVPPSEKARARETVARVTAAATPKPTFVRVNSMASGRAEDDVRAVAGPGLSGVRMAKVARPEDVRQLVTLLAQAGCPVPVHLLIETAHALETAFDLATSSPSVAMISLGESDLCADLRITAESPTMDACRSRVVIASRAAGLPSPCQSVSTDIHDTDALLRTSRSAKALGFVGRMALHPAQIPAIHEVYTPTAQEIADAQAVFRTPELAREADRSVVLNERGGVIAPPILANARNVLRLAEALSLLEAPA
ncbi:CoA ester lyase [Actinocorallia sp. API 0066]|uniref:HpcH/HpaI aldolase/citrate lyase family protein n=1 Tax=Actinocorallia sp. API 0066 TaxID=2896846 RepID=UPI001E3C2EEF|nr:CoA ester lyase [Actinocorallia sp. API 0066]MCD0452111.1 CoA ester lyase [Actinocorallia sp. API 0066]